MTSLLVKLVLTFGLSVCSLQGISCLDDRVPSTSLTISPTTCANAPNVTERPVVTLANGITVVCDTTTDKGGWIIFQRRTSNGVDFYRSWQEYKDGFGVKPDNFWLGLEAIHQLTSSYEAHMELRVDMKYKGKNYFAHYAMFRVLGEDEKYKLELAGYQGDAGDNLWWHRGYNFSTRDSDNDNWSSSCARMSHGGWWYNDHCRHDSNLNGLWASTSEWKGLNWRYITGKYNSVSFSEMKIRPRQP